MTARCHVCGSPDIDADASSIGSSRCAECTPARDHVVSMQGGPLVPGPEGESRAICPCGWRSVVPWGGHHLIQEARVRMHWRTMIRAANEARELAA